MGVLFRHATITNKANTLAMLPRRWTRKLYVPYSSDSPLPERFVRHARETEAEQQWAILVGITALTCLPLSVILMDEVAGKLGVLLPLLIAWGIAIMTILATVVIGALMTGQERHGPEYELLWLTNLSDHALGSSFLFATLYRMRIWIALTLTMIPTLILGMVRMDAWAIERCQLSFYRDGCDPFVPYELSPFSSALLGLSVCIGIVGILPLGATCAVGLALRWRNPIFAAGTTVVGMIFTLGLVVLLSIITIAPPPQSVSIWSALLLLILINIGLVAVNIVATSQRFKDGLDLLFIINILLTVTSVFAMVSASGSIRISIVSVLAVIFLPYGLLVVALNVFWRSARRSIQ